MSTDARRGGSGAPRILIVRVGAMGDVLHGMPAVAALRAALPGVFLGWAVEPRWAPLLRACGSNGVTASLPLVDAVHLVEAKAWSKRPFSFSTLHSVQALRHGLRAERYDIALDLQGSIRSALIAKGSGATRIVGSAAPREAPARLLYTEQVPVTAQHVIEQAADIVAAALHLKLVPAAVPLPVDSAAEAWCETFLSARSGPLVLLAPTAGWGAKQWPANLYGQLARTLAKAGCSVLVNASPNGLDAVAAQVVQQSEHTAVAAACTVPQLIALMRRVHLVVAGDSGPLHLAAALSVPVVALFGPTDPARTGPYGTRSVVLRAPSSRTDHRRHAATESGLATICVGEVEQAALHLLQLASHMPAPRG